MTREEAKEIFLGRGFIDGIYDGNKWREACIVISKWLEQEPFINKPCVSGEVCEHDKQKVLDKIRAEIEKAVWEDVVVSLDGTDEVRIPRLDPDDVFEIINKYKAETEDKE